MAGSDPEADDAVAEPAPEPSTTRPTFTVAEAARATRVSRRTIGRLLTDGSLPGARRDPDTEAWRIPADELLANGLTLHAPDPPDTPKAPLTPLQPPSTAPVATGPDPAELDRLRAEAVEWRRRAEVAEAVATERAATLSDLREALAMAGRMLDTGPMPAAPSRRRRWGRKDDRA